MQTALEARTSVGGATDPRGPVRSATGRQCSPNRTIVILPIVILPNHCGRVRGRRLDASFWIDLRMRRWQTGQPSAERRIHVGRYAPRPAVSVVRTAHWLSFQTLSFQTIADEFAVAA